MELLKAAASRLLPLLKEVRMLEAAECARHSYYPWQPSVVMERARAAAKQQVFAMALERAEQAKQRGVPAVRAHGRMREHAPRGGALVVRECTMSASDLSGQKRACNSVRVGRDRSPTGYDSSGESSVSSGVPPPPARQRREVG